MSNILKMVGSTVGAILGIVFVIAVVYGFYTIVKSISYAFFYEDMVMETIREMVKVQCLN